MILIKESPCMVLVEFLNYRIIAKMKQNTGISISYSISFPLTGNFQSPEVVGLDGIMSYYLGALN